MKNKVRKDLCIDQQPSQRGGTVPNPILVGLKWLLALPRLSVIQGTPSIQIIFSPCCPLNNRIRGTCNLSKIGRLFSLFSSCHTLARLLILLLFLMSGNVHSNPGPSFHCLVYAGNVTWRGWSVQCCTCCEWVHLRCSLLSCGFRTFGSSHSWSSPPCCIPTSSGGSTPTNTVSVSFLSFSLHICSVLPGPSAPPPFLQCSTPSPPSSSNLLPFSRHFVLPLHLPTSLCFWLFSYTACSLLLPSLAQGFSIQCQS